MLAPLAVLRKISHTFFSLFFQLTHDRFLPVAAAIDLDEFNSGLRKMHVGDAVFLSNDDWNTITNYRSLLNEEGELTPAAFEVMIAERRGDGVRWNVFTKTRVLFG